MTMQPAPGTPSSSSAAAPTRRRNQYSLEFKLDIARQYAPGVAGCGFEALARQHGLSKSNVMAWVAKKEQLAAQVAATRTNGGGDAFRLDGCGRKSSYRELEDELERWLRAQEADGVRVRDKDLKAHAMRLFQATPAADAPSSGFKASSGWLARFKQRKNVPVRRVRRRGDDDDSVGSQSPMREQVEAVASGAEDGDGDGDGDDRRSDVSAAEDDVILEATASGGGLETTQSSQAIGSVGSSGPTTTTTTTTSSALMSPTGAPRMAGASSVVTAEWMGSVDRRLDALSQQIEDVAHGQSQLLSLLQRHLTQPPIGSSGSGLEDRPPPPGLLELTTEGAPSADATAPPPLKKRRQGDPEQTVP